MCICQTTIAIPRKGNVERHLRTVKKHNTDPPVISCQPRQSAVSLAAPNFKWTCSIFCAGCPSLVLPPPQPRGYSPPLSLSSAALVSTGLWRCWMVAAPPLLAVSSVVQRRSSWTSAVTSPQAPSLGLDLLVSCVAPAVCMEPPYATFILCFDCFTLSAKMIKEAFVEAADSLFPDFKNKPEILSSIKFPQLSRSTVTQCCEVMARPMKECTQGEFIFQSFKNSVQKTSSCVNCVPYVAVCHLCALMLSIVIYKVYSLYV